MAKKSHSAENLLSTLASITVPLIQLIAVASVALGEQMKAANVFPNPSLLPLLNISSILIILGFISSISTYEKHNNFLPHRSILKNLVHKILPSIFQQEQQFNIPQPLSLKILKYFLLFQLISFCILLSAFVDFFSKTQSNYGLIVYSSYVIFLVSSGLLMYIWLEKFIQRRSYVKPEDFFPNLVDRLRENGKLSERQVELKRSIDLNNGNHLFKIEIKHDSIYNVITNFSVSIIIAIWTEEETPPEVKAQFLFSSPANTSQNNSE